MRRAYALLASLVIIVCGAQVQSSGIHVKPDGDDTRDGLSWAAAKRTVQAGLNATVSGDQVWVAKGIYVERITLKDGVGLYGGFAGAETSFTQRPPFPRTAPDPNETVLDGNQQGSVVTSPPGATASTRIDGLTIRNGIGTAGDDGYTRGGGIWCDWSSPTISNNTITGNNAYLGGGVYSRESIGCALTNNTIVGNTASEGGGLDLLDSRTTTASNNIVAFNSSGISGSYSRLTLVNNVVYNPGGYNYSGLPAGTADISADPLFVDSGGGDYHLPALSPSINAGWNDAPAMPATDVDGEDRIWAGQVDIGADEFWTDPTGPADAKRLSEGQWTALGPLPVSAAFADYFYLEPVARSCGIRVEQRAHGLEEGTQARVTGRVRTNSDGERYIEAATADGSRAVMITINPLYLSNTALGGDAFGMPPRGQSGVLGGFGLLIKTSGTVTYVGEGFFYIDDGSHLEDGSGNIGVKVYCTAPEGNYTPGTFVTLIGISSCERLGDEIVRVIRMTSDE